MRNSFKVPLSPAAQDKKHKKQDHRDDHLDHRARDHANSRKTKYDDPLKKAHGGVSLVQTRKDPPRRQVGGASSANVVSEEIEVVEVGPCASQIAPMDPAKANALDRSHHRFSRLASTETGPLRQPSSEPTTLISRLLSSESVQTASVGKRGSV